MKLFVSEARVVHTQFCSATVIFSAQCFQAWASFCSWWVASARSSGTSRTTQTARRSPTTSPSSTRSGSRSAPSCSRESTSNRGATPVRAEPETVKWSGWSEESELDWLWTVRPQSGEQYSHGRRTATFGSRVMHFQRGEQDNFHSTQIVCSKNQLPDCLESGWTQASEPRCVPLWSRFSQTVLLVVVLTGLLFDRCRESCIAQKYPNCCLVSFKHLHPWPCLPPGRCPAASWAVCGGSSHSSSSPRTLPTWPPSSPSSACSRPSSRRTTSPSRRRSSTGRSRAAPPWSSSG